MDDRTPSTPSPATPDPHSGEPLPDAPVGARTAEGAAVVRPEEDEPFGPLDGLLGASAAAAMAELHGGTDLSEEALLEQMGVEEEGIEGGQILGLVVATVVSVLALAVVLIYLFYIPRLEQVQRQASNVGPYPELERVRMEGLAKLTEFAGSDTTGFSIPIDRAMALTARDYAASAPAGLPVTRAEFNTLMINQGRGQTVGVAPAVAERPEQARLRALQGSAALVPPTAATPSSEVPPTAAANAAPEPDAAPTR